MGKIRSEDVAALVVDVQNDFCHPQGALWHNSPAIAEMDFGNIVNNLAKVLGQLRQAGVDIIFIQTIHSSWTDSTAWKLRKVYHDTRPICMAGSWGAEFFLLAPESNDLVITKNRYSAFLGTNLDLVLRSRNKHCVVLTGFMANVCVETTARDAFQRNYHVYVLEDCVGAVTRREYESALLNIDKYFGSVIRSDSFLTLLS